MFNENLVINLTLLASNSFQVWAVILELIGALSLLFTRAVLSNEETYSLMSDVGKYTKVKFESLTEVARAIEIREKTGEVARQWELYLLEDERKISIGILSSGFLMQLISLLIPVKMSILLLALIMLFISIFLWLIFQFIWPRHKKLSRKKSFEKIFVPNL